MKRYAASAVVVLCITAHIKSQEIAQALKELETSLVNLKNSLVISSGSGGGSQTPDLSNMTSAQKATFFIQKTDDFLTAYIGDLQQMYDQVTNAIHTKTVTPQFVDDITNRMSAKDTSLDEFRTFVQNFVTKYGDVFKTFDFYNQYMSRGCAVLKQFAKKASDLKSAVDNQLTVVQTGQYAVQGKIFMNELIILINEVMILITDPNDLFGNIRDLVDQGGDERDSYVIQDVTSLSKDGQIEIANSKAVRYIFNATALQKLKPIIKQTVDSLCAPLAEGDSVEIDLGGKDISIIDKTGKAIDLKSMQHFYFEIYGDEYKTLMK